MGCLESQVCRRSSPFSLTIQPGRIDSAATGQAMKVDPRKEVARTPVLLGSGTKSERYNC
jgi:hypothetical protein